MPDTSTASDAATVPDTSTAGDAVAGGGQDLPGDPLPSDSAFELPPDFWGDPAEVGDAFAHPAGGHARDGHSAGGDGPAPAPRSAPAARTPAGPASGAGLEDGPGVRRLRAVFAGRVLAIERPAERDDAAGHEPAPEEPVPHAEDDGAGL